MATVEATKPVVDAAASVDFLNGMFDKAKRLLVLIRSNDIKALGISMRTIATANWNSSPTAAVHPTRFIFLYPIKGTLHKKASKADVAAAWFLWVDLDPRKGEPLEAERTAMLALLTANLPPGIPRPNCIVSTAAGDTGPSGD